MPAHTPKPPCSRGVRPPPRATCYLAVAAAGTASHNDIRLVAPKPQAVARVLRATTTEASNTKRLSAGCPRVCMHSEAGALGTRKRRATDVIQRSGSTPLSIPVASLEAMPRIASAWPSSGACIDETANDRRGAYLPRRHPSRYCTFPASSPVTAVFFSHGPSVQTPTHADSPNEPRAAQTAHGSSSRICPSST